MSSYSRCSIYELLKIADDIQIVKKNYPFLKSFFRLYSVKIQEDKNTPLFSKTDTYNHFPTRVFNKNYKKSYNKYKKEKRYIKKNDWRKEKKYNKRKPSIKINTTKINITKILNKISTKNFKSQSNQLLNILIKNKNNLSLKLIGELIIEKIWYDASYYEMYLELCETLWNNNTWIKEMYTISNFISNDRKCYYFSTTIENNKLVGPYMSFKKASSEAIKKLNLKNILLAICRDNFHKRHEYINLLKTSENKYKLKRKIIGTVEIFAYLAKKKYIHIDILHYILVSILNRKYNILPEEIESLKAIWDIVLKIVDKKSINEYRKLLKDIYTMDWEYRIRFMIEDMIEFKQSNDKKDNIKDTKFIENNIVTLSRNNKRNNIEKLLKNINDSSLFIVLFSELLRDLSEYGEYINNHINTILTILNKENSASFSKAFNEVGNDIADIKIDAPKAPINISNALGNILKNTNNIYINIEIDKDYYIDAQPEWNNILQLTEKFIEKDIISKHIKILNINT